MLFGYLGYNGKKTREIMQYLRKQTGVQVKIDELNQRLEKGIGVEYYNEALRAAKGSDDAKYMLLDSGYVAKGCTEDSEHVFIEIIKVRGIWTEGFVGLHDNLLKINREHENNAAEMLNMQSEVADVVEDKKMSDKEKDEAINKIEDKYTKVVTVNKLKDGIAARIKECMIDCNDYWTEEKITNCIEKMCTIVALEIGKDANCTSSLPDWFAMRNDSKEVVFSSGFIGFDMKPINLRARVVEKRINQGIANYVLEDVDIIGGFDKCEYRSENDKRRMEKMLEHAVQLSDTPDLVIGNYGIKFHGADVNIDNVSIGYAEHCVKDRGDRVGEKFKKLSYREAVRRINECVDMAFELQKNRVSMIAPTYCFEDKDWTFVVPFYVDRDVVLSKPDAFIQMKFVGSVFVPSTLLTTDMVTDNVRVVDKYASYVWLK